MDQATHSKIIPFLWGIADDVLRDLFKRGKYLDVILPMCVLRRLEPELALRDTEQVQLLEPAGVETFLRREVLPHLPDARIDPGSIKTGYEISCTRYFYQPKPLRTLEEIRADNLAMEKESEGLLDELLKGGAL